ncbi:hypothetical protein AB6A40_011672, partial [Gnathostoma spinigerum]
NQWVFLSDGHNAWTGSGGNSSEKLLCNSDHRLLLSCSNRFLIMSHLQKGEERFWRQPLGAWIKDCVTGRDALIPEHAWRSEDRHDSMLQFIELCDGFVLNLLFVLV